MDPYQQALEERIREYWQFRQWLRFHPNRITLSPQGRAELVREYTRDLQVLFAVRGVVRRKQRVNAKGDHFVGIGR